MNEPNRIDHRFEASDANPTICRHCGAVKPMPCYPIDTKKKDES